MNNVMDPSMLEKMLRNLIDIQQIPAPTFQEKPRGIYVHQQFKEEGLDSLEIDQLGNVYGRMPGKMNIRPIIVSAHLDTVFPGETDLKITRFSDRIIGPGIGDNSLGVASLLGLVRILKRMDKLTNDIWFVANVGEEGLGNLCGMKSVVERFGGHPKAYIVIEGMSLGSIYHRGLSVKRYRIKVDTQGGHSWVNFGRPSAVHEMARFISGLENLTVPQSPKASYNVGLIEGGTSINTIAAQAKIELDLRSENQAILDQLAFQIEQRVLLANQAGEELVEFSYEIIGERPTGEISPGHQLVRFAEAALKGQLISPHLEIGSTDANIPLSRGYPSVCVGITKGSGAHTLNELIELDPIQKGMEQLLDLVKDVDRYL